MTLDARLSLVASLIPLGARIADVGTDHAHLPIALVSGGHCPSAVATDIHEGPFQKAVAAVRDAALQDVIAVRLCDGLAAVAAEEVDTVVIAGMGGETIAAILQAAPWTQAPDKTLVLQPMSKPERLRTWLADNGFAIAEERTAAEGRRLYAVLRAVYDPPRAAAQAADPVFAYVGALTPQADRLYWERVAARLRAAAQAAGGSALPEVAAQAAHDTAVAEALQERLTAASSQHLPQEGYVCKWEP